MKEEIQRLLKSREHKLCVLGTSTNNAQPWCAVVGYAVDANGAIIISTHTSSKKWQQMKENNKVSLVFGFSFEEVNIQCEGTVELVERGDSFQKMEDFFFSVNPSAKQFKTDDTAFALITPTTVRLSDYSVSPPRIEEGEYN